MANITFIAVDGTRYDVQASPGMSAMEAAVNNDVPGIDGDCGGHAACATCHVFVEPVWLDKTGKAGEENERPMLELAEGVQDNSRLACQIVVNDDLDGLILHMPAQQF